MTGHHKFSKLTKNFSPERKAKIAIKTAQIQEEIDSVDAKRITPPEINEAKTGINEQFGEEYLLRKTNINDELVSLKLDKKIINWAKEEAEKQGINYQVFLNQELLKLCS